MVHTDFPGSVRTSSVAGELPCTVAAATEINT